MSEQLFSEAMGELSDKYISEAINYKGKKKEQKHAQRVPAPLLFIFYLSKRQQTKQKTNGNFKK